MVQNRQSGVISYDFIHTRILIQPRKRSFIPTQLIRLAVNTMVLIGGIQEPRINTLHLTNVERS